MISFVSEEMRRNPYPVYDQIRPHSPVQEPTVGFWMIFDYDGVKRALYDHESFSSDTHAAGWHRPDWFIFMDPPQHTKLRGLISKAFTPRMVADLEPRIRELSRMHIDRVIDRGYMDLASEYSVPFAMKVIAGMLGVPDEDWEDYRRWSDTILQLSYVITRGPAGDEASKQYFVMKAEMEAYLAKMLEERRSKPKDDLLTGLMEAEVDGEKMTALDILWFFQLLLVAGQETTANLINNTVLSLIENPKELARLHNDHSLMPYAIEEALRYRSPISFTFRATKLDVEMGGRTIPAGKLVLAVIGSANRDPKQFRDADKFDIGRNPNPHIAFGHGVHFCLGAALSRLEAMIAIPDLLERLGKIELATDKPLPPRKALNVFGPDSLPIKFDAARGAAAQA